MTDLADTGHQTLNEGAMRTLSAQLRGRLIRPQDAEYETARHVWNGMIDRHPAVIVRCISAADVIAAVNMAREHGLAVAVRGGSHNVAGNAVCDGGMVIDLTEMKGIRVDAANRTVRAEPGLTWAEFDRETQEFGLATTGGLVSTTGVAGFTLGGGIGWLVRKYGLACDNLRSVDIVTADGTLRTASPIENADLFWGVRGGGGNFGVVTSFEFQLYSVGPMVLGGAVFHPLERAADVLRFYREFVASAPDELTTLVAIITAPPLPFIPEDLRGKPSIAIAACYSDAEDQGEAVLRPLHSFGPPAADVIGPIPYTALQGMFDEGAPAGLHNYWKSHYLGALEDDVIEVIVQHAAAMPAPFGQIHLHQLGGAISRVPSEATAFGHRDAAYVLNIIGTWADPGETDQDIQWVRDFWAPLQRYSRGVYVNFTGEEGDEVVRSAYDANAYDRLVALKQKYDPSNFFRLNQNIKP
jgi:FAD/FMN-containing dehydrogenase